MHESPGEQGFMPRFAAVAVLHVRLSIRIEYTERFDNGDAA
jgi:hypothetical protein